MLVTAQNSLSMHEEQRHYQPRMMSGGGHAGRLRVRVV